MPPFTPQQETRLRELIRCEIGPYFERVDAVRDRFAECGVYVLGSLGAASVSHNPLSLRGRRRTKYFSAPSAASAPRSRP